ncbi:hypothetical protein [Klebsiella oxytoca]|nr:hypothetical protein [Klebsiella oxytoca]
MKAAAMLLAALPLAAAGAFFNAVVYEIPSDRAFISQPHAA